MKEKHPHQNSEEKPPHHKVEEKPPHLKAEEKPPHQKVEEKPPHKNVFIWAGLQSFTCAGGLLWIDVGTPNGGPVEAHLMDARLSTLLF